MRASVITPTRVFSLFAIVLLTCEPTTSLAGSCNIGGDYAYNGQSPAALGPYAVIGNTSTKFKPDPVGMSDGSGCLMYHAQCHFSFEYMNPDGTVAPAEDDCVLFNYYEAGVMKGHWECPATRSVTEAPATPLDAENGLKAYFNEINARPEVLVKTRYTGPMECTPYTDFTLPAVQNPVSPVPARDCSNSSSPGGVVGGSSIECRDGVVDQYEVVTGTPFSLHYSSREAEGNRGSRRNQIHITDFSVPGTINKVILDTQIAGTGRSFHKEVLVGAGTLSADLDASLLVDWDGLNTSGQAVFGFFQANTTVTYEVTRDDTPGTLRKFYNTYGNVFEHNNDVLRFKMNGWSLSSYHRFEPKTNTIYSGSGSRIPAEKFAQPTYRTVESDTIKIVTASGGLRTLAETLSPSLTWHRDASSNLYIPSSDRKEIFKFSSTGLHLETLTADLGSSLYKFSHDAQNRLVSITDRNGLITSIQRDASGNLTSMTSPTGEITKFTIDTAGFISSITDPSGKVTKFTYGTGGALGLMLTYTNPRGFAKSYSYDSTGRLLKTVDFKGAARNFLKQYSNGSAQSSVTTALGRTSYFSNSIDGSRHTSYTNSEADGTYTSVDVSSDGLSRTTTQGNTGEYTQSALVQSSQFPGRSTLGSETIFAAGLQFNVKQTEAVTKPTSSTIPYAVSTRTNTLDLEGLGSFKTVFDQATKTYTYTTPSGRTIKSTVNAKGDPVSVTIGNLTPLQYTYDTRGRVSKLTQSTRNTTIAYDAKDLPTSVTNSLGEIQKFTFDANRRPTSVILPNGKAIALTYDANGNTTKVTLPGLQAYGYTLDKKDFVTTNTEPTIGTSTFQWGYQYSLDDELTKVTHPDTSLLNYEYTAGGQLSRISGPNIDRSYAFNGPLLNSIANASGDAVNFSWNGSLPASVNWTGALINGSVEYAWGPFRRLASTTVNGQPFASYTYTPEGEPSKVNGMAITRIATTGLVSQTKLGTVTTKFGYNSFGEVTSESVLLGTTTLSSVTYTRDALGRIATLARTENGVTTTKKYTYDTQAALLTETVGTTTTGTFFYDTNGNRLTRNGAEIYDTQDRLASDVNWTYTYSGNGFLMKKSHKTNGTVIDYAYDNLGNLLQVRNSKGSTVDYTVDGMDRRIVRKVSGVFSDGFLYQDSLRPAAQLNANGSIRSLFVYGTRFNSPDIIVKGGVVYRVVHDHVGSPIYVINTANSAVAQKITYDAWGNILTDSSPGFQPFGFAGGLYDNVTGLVRFGARDYDPTIGRWLNKDPIRFEGGWNLYGYVGNDPVNFVDPDGLKLWYADKETEGMFKPIVKNLMRSPAGRALLSKLHKSNSTYYINYQPNEAKRVGNNVYVDPYIEKYICTSQGIKPSSAERILAHELGHLTGTFDDGDGLMNNVNTWENPIMQPIEGFLRIKY